MSSDLKLLNILQAPPAWNSDPQAVAAHERLKATSPRNLERPWRLVRGDITLATATTRDELEPLAEGSCYVVGPATT